MDFDMAYRAVLKPAAAQIVEGGRHTAKSRAAAQPGMAFQALETDFMARQHPRIGRAMRFMAGAAAFHPHRGMFEGEWAALVAMAAEAAGLVGRDFPQRIRAQQPAVRIMAIHALHATFLKTVAVGLLKLGHGGGMAGAAHLERLFGLGGVHGVAIGAPNLIPCVAAANGPYSRGLILVAFEAGDRFRPADIGGGGGVRMRATRTMAAFTGFALPAELRIGLDPAMRRPGETFEDLFVAGLADLRPHVFFLRRGEQWSQDYDPAQHRLVMEQFGRQPWGL